MELVWETGTLNHLECRNDFLNVLCHSCNTGGIFSLLEKFILSRNVMMRILQLELCY